MHLVHLGRGKGKAHWEAFFSLVLSCLVFSLPVLLASMHYHCITRLNKGTLAFFGASGSVYEEFVTLFFLLQLGIFKSRVCVVQ